MSSTEKQEGEAALPSLRGNIIALGFLQGANYVIPLITLPYLARTLGPEGFGKVAFVQVLMQYLIVFTDYGFSWSAVNALASQRNNPENVSKISLSTWYAQWLIFLLVGGGFLVAVYVVPFLYQEYLLYLVGLSLVLGNVLFPLWLFNGLELMKEIASIQVLVRLLMLIPLFVLVQSADDVVWAVGVMGVTSVLSGVFGIYWIIDRKIIRFQWPDLKAVKSVFLEGGGLFLSRISVSLYTLLTPLILAAISGTTAVGYFNLADKIRMAAQSLLNPLSQAMFPRLAHLFSHDAGAARELLKKSFGATVILAGSMGICLWLFAPEIVLLIGGKAYESSVTLLRWFAFLPLVVGLSNVLGVQIMIPNQDIKAFNTILGSAGLLSLAIVFPLVYYHNEEGAALTFFVVELFVLLAMAGNVCRKGYLGRTESLL